MGEKSPDAAVLQWLEEQDDESLFISAVAVGEMRKGIERLPLDDPRRPRLESWCNSVVRSFENRVIPFDGEIAQEWGRIVGAGMRTGKQKPEVDMQIVATAFKHGMTLVTRNVKDMGDSGVPIINPFECPTNNRGHQRFSPNKASQCFPLSCAVQRRLM